MLLLYQLGKGIEGFVHPKTSMQPMQPRCFGSQQMNIFFSSNTVWMNRSTSLHSTGWEPTKNTPPPPRKTGEKFTEVFCRERLELVFGESNVYPNVRIVESKRRIRGEIDVLVVFGNRAIVVQAKSKQLTLESRKGNDRQLRDDFKKSVQDSYDQGFLCAESLNNPRFSLVEADGQELAFPYEPKEIYILCVVADHYPALYFHVRQFSQIQEN